MELTDEDKKFLATILNNANLDVSQGVVRHMSSSMSGYKIRISQYHDLIKKLYPEAETE